MEHDSDPTTEHSPTRPWSRSEHESWLRGKLQDIDRVEKKIEAAGPGNQLREAVGVLALLAVAIGAGVVASFDASPLAITALLLAMVTTIATGAAVVGRPNKIDALERKRDRLLSEMERDDNEA